MPVGLVSLLVGVAAVVWYMSASQFPPPALQVVNTPGESRSTCKGSLSFPGRSISINEASKPAGWYFPKGTFDDGWQNQDAGVNEWYGKFLKAAGEQSLITDHDENLEIYRFLWLRSFHHPVMIRVVRDGYFFNLVSVELSGAGGYEPGRKWATAKMTISQDDWCAFISLLEKASFWSMESTRTDEIGNDGAQWILEGMRKGRYHLVDRWSPRNGDYREACLFLIKLTGRDERVAGNDLY